MSQSIDTAARDEIAQAVAKAIAYKNCGKDKEAHEWAIKIVELLRCTSILHYVSK
jgi:hypothetical protein